MKSILIVSRSFYPINSPRSFRTTELAKELARQGHAVTVLTPKRPEHRDFEQEHNLIIQDLGAPKWKEVKLTGKGARLMFKRGLRRGLNLFLEYPNLEFYFKVKRALQQKKKNKEHYDLLISIAVPYPIHWGVAAIWKKKKNIAKTWVADCGDPFMGQENDTFKHPVYFKYVEKWFCKKADFITVPVETAIPAYYPEFHHKIKIISQGFNFEEIKLASYKQNEIPHFAYAGGLIPGRRDPKDFLDFLVNYPHQYKFYIYTKQVGLVQSYADRSQGRIEIKEYLPRKELLFELSKLDFVVNFENAGQKQIPSKIIDYVIINKPILSVNTFNFNKQPIVEFLSGNYKKGLVIDKPEQYRIENVAKEFLKLANS
jgi:hypothetical protein